MNLVFNCHHFPHKELIYSIQAGAELFAKRFLEGWIAAGHSATVVDKRKVRPCTMNNLRIIPREESEEVFAEADILMTHLDETVRTMDLARYWKKPLVHMVHNHIQVMFHQAQRKADFFLFCANWVAREYKTLVAGTPWQVCYPLVFSEEWKTDAPLEQRDIVLLSNVNENKGGDLLPAIAEALPNVNFVGIVGAYNEQMVYHDLPNVKYIPHTPDVLDWYKRARVVICPSKYESFGRVPVEAFASGIPVVATGTDGLLESVSWGGQIVPAARRNILDEWTHRIKKLYFDDEEWYFWNRQARLRSLQLDAIQKQQLETAIYQLEMVAEAYRKGKGKAA